MIKIKYLKLNKKGITQILAPLAFVVIFAIVGSIVLLKSHAATSNSNVTCSASASPNPVDWNYNFQVKLTIHNGKSVYFTPFVGYNIIYYTPTSWYGGGTATQFNMNAIPPGGSESYYFTKQLPKPDVKMVISFSVKWGQTSTTYAARCSVTINHKIL
ncbi:MAG TPA: hypothetical protein VFH37_01400 [Candidatus Saccharimonadales bacterium]|nr:hypothetical protein [Candidatus Saccharimonadales bacterium]